MVDVTESRWEWLDRKSAALFLVAGTLLVVFAAFLGVEAFTDASAPEDAFGPPGYAVAMVGLLGLYPALSDRSPWLARVGAVVAAGSAAGWIVITVTSLGEIAGELPPLEDAGALGITIILAAGMAMVLAYLSFGIASLRSDDHSRIVGILLLVPPAVFFVMIATVSMTPPEWLSFVLGGGQALAHLAIGAALRADGRPTDRVEPTPDTTAR